MKQWWGTGVLGSEGMTPGSVRVAWGRQAPAEQVRLLLRLRNSYLHREVVLGINSNS